MESLNLDQNQNLVLNNESVRDLIYEVRGQQVMLDVDLASIYGYTTKAFNQQVKNNKEKFDADFMFQLTREEYVEILRSKNLTLRFQHGKFSKYLPFVFTEQGIYMLMTVLKGPLAIKQSKFLIRLFKEMKDYIVGNKALIGNKELLQIYHQTVKNTADIVSIKESMISKCDINAIISNFTSTLAQSEYLIFNGQTIEALLAYKEIYSLATTSIYIIDNYIGIKTLVLLKDINPSVNVIIFTDNIGNILHLCEYNDFIKEYPNVKIKFIATKGIFHDRYIVIDYNTPNEVIYHCGASSKDAGNRVTSITKLEYTSLYHSLIDMLLLNPEKKLNKPKQV